MNREGLSSYHAGIVYILKANNLVKSYNGRVVVNHVSYDVAEGEIVGLLGRNGAGKTTSFRMTVGNRVIRVQADGRQEVVLEDSDSAHLDWVEEAYLAGTMDRPHLDRAAGRRLKNISSLAFGGADLRTVYLGCLLGDAVASFRSDVPGLPPYHWNNCSFAEKLQA